jgi:hypothetical protein
MVSCRYCFWGVSCKKAISPTKIQRLSCCHFSTRNAVGKEDEMKVINWVNIGYKGYPWNVVNEMRMKSISKYQSVTDYIQYYVSDINSHWRLDIKVSGKNEPELALSFLLELERCKLATIEYDESDILFLEGVKTGRYKYPKNKFGVHKLKCPVCQYPFIESQIMNVLAEHDPNLKHCRQCKYTWRQERF